jgi:uncharacterized membrane protein YGL010W
MAARKTAEQWFAECAERHQHPVNRLIHWICAPVILACLLGFIWTIPVPESWQETMPWFNWILIAMAGATVSYARLSPALSAGMLFFMAVCYAAIVLLELFAPWPVGRISMIAFALAWIGQMIGRGIERQVPSFYKDVVFLFVGPAWLLSLGYQKIGQKY